MKRLLGFILVLFCTSTIFARGNFAAPAQDKPLSSIAEKTAGIGKLPASSHITGMRAKERSGKKQLATVHKDIRPHGALALPTRIPYLQRFSTTALDTADSVEGASSADISDRDSSRSLPKEYRAERNTLWCPVQTTQQVPTRKTLCNWVMRQRKPGARRAVICANMDF